MKHLGYLVLAGAALLGGAGQSLAQENGTPAEPLQTAAAPQKPVPPDSHRACDGCPARRVGWSLLQVTGINVVYELANLARGQVTARITPASWWANMEQGWVWDLDDFTVNQVGHPYQGNNYFNAGRANGLSFWESAAATAFGSATWEYFGETNHASLNDFINTTLGGIALGEMFHRAGWLIRDTHKTGKARLWSEIGATALDPITGLNRFASGDASRVSDKPPDFVPSSVGGVTSAGILWRGTQGPVSEASGQAFLETDLFYGNVENGRSRTPYDAFNVRLRFGGGSAFSEAHVRAQLVGQPLRHETLQFNVMQSYDYESNDAYATGSQSFEAALASASALSTHLRLTTMGWAGLTVLGAIDSLPLGVTEKPPEAEPSAGQGVSEGPRFYDYGPGSDFGGFAHLDYDGRTLGAILYEAHHIYSLDGVRANHFLQHLRVDAIVPVRGRFGVGVAGEYFYRKSFYQDPGKSRQTFHYPQVRAFLSWSQR